MSPVHEASLVDPSLHSDEMLELLELDLDRDVIDHLVQTTIDTVSFAYKGPSTSQSRGRSNLRSDKHASFRDFVSQVLCRAEITISTLLVTLVYIDRSKPHLSIETEDWACERVFLGALVLASKYANDSTLKNVHWALVTGTFGKRDIGRIEREFLEVLNWELGFSESDILSHRPALMALRPRKHHQTSITRLDVSPVRSEISSVSTDSDSDMSSSPSPLTPPSLLYEAPLAKPTSDSAAKQSRPFRLSQLFSGAWHTASQLPAIASQIHISS